MRSLNYRLGIEQIPSDITGEQLDALRALVDQGDLGRARRIALCLPLSSDLTYEWRRSCRLWKLCTYCAERWGRQAAGRLVERSKAFKYPTAVLITSPSRTIQDLANAVTQFKRQLFRLRRRKSFEWGCSGAALALEVPLTRDRRRWNLHAHGILDAPGASDKEWVQYVQDEWRALSERQGALFAFEQLRDVRELSRYAVKLGNTPSFCNPRLPGVYQATLGSALRYKRLLVSWTVRNPDRV